MKKSYKQVFLFYTSPKRRVKGMRDIFFQVGIITTYSTSSRIHVVLSSHSVSVHPQSNRLSILHTHRNTRVIKNLTPFTFTYILHSPQNFPFPTLLTLLSPLLHSPQNARRNYCLKLESVLRALVSVR